jgi:hypothetical protein
MLAVSGGAGVPSAVYFTHRKTAGKMPAPLKAGHPRFSIVLRNDSRAAGRLASKIVAGRVRRSGGSCQ